MTTNIETRVILLKNLMARMDYNDAQGTWKLTGVITMEERTALQQATEALESRSNQ